MMVISNKTIITILGNSQSTWTKDCEHLLGADIGLASSPIYPAKFSDISTQSYRELCS